MGAEKGDPVTGERDERLAVQGPRGPQGNQGNRGARGVPGLSRSIRRALVYLFALAATLSIGNLLWTAHETHASRAAIQSEYASEQAAQKREGQIVVRALCITFTKLAALKPPAGNPATNPSRAYLQGQHDTLDQLGADLGCK